MADDSAPHAAPPALSHDRDPGDAWVVSSTGERFWGRFGAAGLLAIDPSRGVLLQHRAHWSHHGGTWGIPGGALHQGESAHDAALREAGEEAGVPRDVVRPRAVRVLDRGVWRYTTVIADVEHQFDPFPGDAESLELRWVPVQDVDTLDLHPAFANAWGGLRALLDTRPAIVVDVLTPRTATGERASSDSIAGAETVLAQLDRVAAHGVSAHALGLDGARWYPHVDAVVGRADADAAVRGDRHAGAVTLVAAGGPPREAVLERSRERIARGFTVVVVTDDSALADESVRLGAASRGHDWLSRAASA